MSNPLRIVPLGGLGEIGRNMMALECGPDIVVIDSGLMFPEQEMLGIDLVIPDISWLIERKEKVRAICLTHGHEDHVGALSYILPRLDVPVYGTPLSLALARNKLKEHQLANSSQLHEVKPGDVQSFGVFSVEWIHTTHSVPDSCALAIRTPHGVIVHTGDFKLDPTPIHGTPPDFGRFAQLGDEGVLLLMSDSTNAEMEGMTASERSVGHGLAEIIDEAKGRVIVAAFASNLGRVQQVIDIADANGRRCFLAGRSMLNNLGAAAELGFLSRKSDFLSVKQVQSARDEDVVVLCTGAQGEPFSALTRIARGDHPMVTAHPGDTVIISANPIPGNEEAVHRTINRLYQRGARVFSGGRHKVHTSGHAAREELRMMLSLVKPKYFIPVHGEYRHLAIHAELGASVGIPSENVCAIDNGTIVEIDENGLRVTSEKAPCEYVYVEGFNLDESGGETLRDRRDMANDGVVVISMVLDRRSGQPLTEPELITRGMPSEGDMGRLIDDARDHLRRRLSEADGDLAGSELESFVQHDVARFLAKRSHRHPLILPLITRI